MCRVGSGEGLGSTEGAERADLAQSLEVLVVVQQRALDLQGELSDQAVDRAAHRQSAAPAVEVEAGGGDVGLQEIIGGEPRRVSSTGGYASAALSEFSRRK